MLTVGQALHHAYFFQPPNPTHHSKLPKSKPVATQEQDDAVQKAAAKDLIDSLKGGAGTRKRKSSGVHDGSARPPALRHADTDKTASSVPLSSSLRSP